MTKTASLKRLCQIRAERERIALARSGQQRTLVAEATDAVAVAHRTVQHAETERKTMIAQAFEDVSNSRNPTHRINMMLRTMRTSQDAKNRAHNQLKLAQTLQAKAERSLARAIAAHGSQKRALDTLDDLLVAHVAHDEATQELEEAEVTAELAILLKVMNTDV